MNFNSPVVTILWFVVLIAIFWFLLLRPQRQEQKRREDMIKSLQRGAKVVTMGGLHGTIVDLNDETAILRIADKVDITVSRTSVGSVQASRDKQVAGPRARQDKDAKGAAALGDDPSRAQGAQSDDPTQ